MAGDEIKVAHEEAECTANPKINRLTLVDIGYHGASGLTRGKNDTSN
jgi:hypothetical protein